MAAAEVQIPATYKAAVYDEPGKISTKIEELKTPEPGPGEVLIHLYMLRFALRKPQD
jgi:propanol-preferring alcohol dehydrogenase